MITDLKINEEKKKEYYEKGYWTHDTIADIWERTSAAHPDREYVCDDTGSRLTYGEVDDKAGRVAAWLVAEGVEAGDVVTLQFPTWAEFTIAYVAVLKVGGVVHPVPRNYNDVDLEYAMNLVGSRAYLSPTFSHNTDYEAQILSVRDAIPSLAAIAVLDKQAPSHSELPTFDDIYGRFEPLREPVAVSADSVACILPTSGTTGKPKQSMLTHNNILFSERVFTSELGRTQGDVMFMPSPLNHATGFFHGLISPLLLGGRAVLQQDFRPREAIELMNAEGVTWSMSATPFIYDIVKYLDAHPDESLPTYVLHSCGGAPVPGALIDRAHNHDILLCEIFGSTESCPHVFVPPSKCVEWNGDWSGIPFPGIEVRYIDEQGNDVAPGVQGEHISRGPHQFVGYLNEPERTDRALSLSGVFDECMWIIGNPLASTLAVISGLLAFSFTGMCVVIGALMFLTELTTEPPSQTQLARAEGISRKEYRGRVGHHRHARRPPGRAHLHLRGASGGHGADPGVGHGLPGRRGRAQAPVARAHRDHRRDPRHRHWQGEALHPRANLEGAHGSGVISSPSVE